MKRCQLCGRPHEMNEFDVVHCGRCDKLMLDVLVDQRGETGWTRR